MGDKSSIEWTDATWNPVTGCSHVSPGCLNCYAETLSLRRKWSAKPWTKQNAAENVKLHPERLDQPLRWRKSRRVFVNSMSDLFHELVPFEFVDQVFAVMALASQHTFQVLTKRPERMLEWALSRSNDPGQFLFAGALATDMTEETACWAANYVNGFSLGHDGHGGRWPLPHVWLGASVEDQRRADERLPLLRQVPAAVRFLSVEPMLSPVDLGDDAHHVLPGIHWVICGGESGHGARRMDPDWARSLRDQCSLAGVPFLFKQWGGRTPKAGGRELDGRTWNEYPAIRVEA